MSENDLKGKRPQESEVSMTELVIPNDANILGNVLGGRVMHWIDLAAATAAHRHCNAICVTAAIEGLSFLNPIKLGYLAHLKAHKVDPATSTLGPWLECDRENECFKDHDKANELVRGYYREPYVVPDLST